MKRGAIIALVLIAASHVVFVIPHYPRTAFIAVDPSSIFVSNAIKVIHDGSGSYGEDPAIAYYLFLAAALLPLKLFTLMTDTRLIEFAYLHIEQIITYLQLVSLGGALAGLYLMSRAVVRLTRAEWAGLFSILAFLAIHPDNYKWTVAVNSECFVIFISGLLLFIIAVYITEAKKKKGLLYLSFFLSGVACAAKATAMPLVIFLFLYLFAELMIRRAPARERMVSTGQGALFALLGFAIPASVAGRAAFDACTRVFRTVISTPPHGAGQSGFDLRLFLENINTLVTGRGFLLFALTLCALLLLYGFIRKRGAVVAGQREMRVAFMALGSAILFTILIAEDVMGRYLIAAFMLEAFAIAVMAPHLLVSDRLKYVRYILIGVFLLQAVYSHQAGARWRTRAIGHQEMVTALLERGSVDTQSDRIVYAPFHPTREFFFMRGTIFTDHIWDTCIEKYQPNFYRFRGKRINTGLNKPYTGSWDYAILDKRDRDIFMRQFPSRVIAREGRFSLLQRKRALFQIEGIPELDDTVRSR